MTTSRGVTIMKNVMSGTCGLCDDEGALADLVAPLDGESSVAKHTIDDLRRMECVHRRHLRRLRLQVLPTFCGSWIDIVDNRVAAGLQCARNVFCVQPDHPELELDECIGRENQIQP